MNNKNYSKQLESHTHDQVAFLQDALAKTKRMIADCVDLKHELTNDKYDLGSNTSLEVELARLRTMETTGTFMQAVLESGLEGIINIGDTEAPIEGDWGTAYDDGDWEIISMETNKS